MGLRFAGSSSTCISLELLVFSSVFFGHTWVTSGKLRGPLRMLGIKPWLPHARLVPSCCAVSTLFWCLKASPHACLDPALMAAALIWSMRCQLPSSLLLPHTRWKVPTGWYTDTIYTVVSTAFSVPLHRAEEFRSHFLGCSIVLRHCFMPVSWLDGSAVGVSQSKNKIAPAVPSPALPQASCLLPGSPFRGEALLCFLCSVLGQTQ